jgi:hypothetical protein
VVDERFEDGNNNKRKIIPLAIWNMFSVCADEKLIYAPHSVIRGHGSGTNLSSDNVHPCRAFILATSSKSIAKTNEILLTGKRKSTWIAQL